jgi:hypothetical protein
MRRCCAAVVLFRTCLLPPQILFFKGCGVFCCVFSAYATERFLWTRIRFETCFSLIIAYESPYVCLFGFSRFFALTGLTKGG